MIKMLTSVALATLLGLAAPLYAGGARIIDAADRNPGTQSNGVSTPGTAESTGGDLTARRAAALQLVQTMRLESRFRGYFEEYLAQRMAQKLSNNPIAREIFNRIVLEKTNFISQIKDSVVSTYAAAYSEAELRELNIFYGSALGQKELDLKGSLDTKVMGSITGNPAFVKEVYVAGCIGAIALEFVSRAEQTAGPLGMEMPNAETVYAKIAPLLTRAEASCSCMVDQIARKFGTERLAKSGSDPEVAAFARDAMTMGSCPKPAAL